MKFSISFTAICFLLFGYGCKRQCIQQNAVYSIGSEMYNYVFLDTSVFVYVNTSTGAIDTEVMFSEKQGMLSQDTSDKCVNLQKQIYTMDFYDKLTRSNSTFFIDYNGITLNGTGVFPNLGTVIFDTHADSIGDSTFYVKYVAFYYSLTILENNIYNVKEFYLNNKTSEYPNSTYLYWAPQCGIVRTEIHDSLGNVNTWDLALSKSNLIYL